MKRIVIIGATSGIGKEVALLYIRQGWRVGIAGRRIEKLDSLKEEDPDRVVTKQIDVTTEESVQHLQDLISTLGGMDVFLLTSGIGFQNVRLEVKKELETDETNVTGFTRMVTTAYHHFTKKGNGHIAVISSIAGTKGIGIAPSYSATKRYQNTYIDALAQLTRMKKISIIFTDIRPGFVRTPLLSDEPYPFQMEPEKVARHILKAIERKKRKVVIDWRYNILVFFWRMIPQWLWERISIHT